MRLYRMSFVAGFAAGFLAGSRAGRERYDQIVTFAKNAAAHPAVQQAAGNIQAQASTAAQKVGSQLQDKMPQMAQSAAHTIGDHVPGFKHHGQSAGDGHGAGRPFAATSGSQLHPTE